MSIGLIGRKCGMTRIFTESGDSIPVSVIRVELNKITQIKTTENDGYRAVQVTAGRRRLSRVKKTAVGHFAKANVAPGDMMSEFRLNDNEGNDFKVGDELTVAVMENVKKVDVTGTSIGKGYAGTVKRWNFRTQDATHGNSRAHRVPGSIGQNQTPGRVFKGKKMTGHMGNRTATAQNLELVKVDAERGLLLVKGGVPGAPEGKLIITPAVKQAA
jgi:large subunit ribosomal protein L3